MILERRHSELRGSGPFACDCGEIFDTAAGSACPQCGQQALLGHRGVIDAVIEQTNGNRLVVTAIRDHDSRGWLPIDSQPIHENLPARAVIGPDHSERDW